MMSAAKDHVLDTDTNDLTGHTGSDASQPKDRQEKYVQLQGMSGENIDYGDKEPIEVIICLAIDDNVPDRGHRENLF